MLFMYYRKIGDSGVISIFIITFVYVGLLVLNTFIFYNYLVFLHMEGRLIDIYARATADPSYFFIPFDNEVSSRYLRWIITKIKFENSMIRGNENTKHAAITYHTVTDPDGNYKKNLTYISIYRRRMHTLFHFHRG